MPCSNVETPLALDALLISGKRAPARMEGGSCAMLDALSVFDTDGQYLYRADPVFDQCNGKLAKDQAGVVYQVNHRYGLVRLSDNRIVVAPGVVILATEPGSSSEIGIGIDTARDPWVGRPILDAAFDADGFVYVAPVTVMPNTGLPYAAVAQLALLDGAAAYEPRRLCAAVPPFNDNQDTDSIREIELDDSGNLYVLNANAINESDVVWKFRAVDGQLTDRLDLGDPTNAPYCPAPTAMCVSRDGRNIYVGSSLNPADANSVALYAIDTDCKQLKTVEISGMGHITGITQDPATGDLWVVGFTMSTIPDYLDAGVEAFYRPSLVQIPHSFDDADAVEARSLSNPDNLSLPLSVLWTGDTAHSDPG